MEYKPILITDKQEKKLWYDKQYKQVPTELFYNIFSRFFVDLALFLRFRRSSTNQKNNIVWACEKSEKWNKYRNSSLLGGFRTSANPENLNISMETIIHTFKALDNRFCFCIRGEEAYKKGLCIDILSIYLKAIACYVATGKVFLHPLAYLTADKDCFNEKNDKLIYPAKSFKGIWAGKDIGVYSTSTYSSCGKTLPIIYPCDLTIGNKTTKIDDNTEGEIDGIMKSVKQMMNDKVNALMESSQYILDKDGNKEYAVIQTEKLAKLSDF